ncbi:hypothetical protein TNCV_1659501 [Trichonephila clavipes]|nr:hypothetical protein TNCV_1659501 [Trichonephila clavipes]
MSTVLRTICDANACSFQSRVKKVIPSTLLQTASYDTSEHRMMRNRLNLLCYGLWCGCAIHHFYAHNPPVFTGSLVTRAVRSTRFDHRSLLHPAMTDSYHSCLGSPKTFTDFSEG